jgi:hypothetical protein
MKGEYWLTIVTLINALLVIIVAIRQYKLSKDRFKFDLFEKRYAIYKAVQTFLIKIRDQKVGMYEIDEFKYKTQDSAFLFENDITVYVKELASKAMDLWEKQESLKGIPKGEKRSTICEEITNLSDWFNKQLPELKKKFEPYLAFNKWK